MFLLCLFTDQKMGTRLGEYGNGEWITGLTVERQGNFTKSGVGEVDEAEIFKGDENTLVMTQTYTHEFQCKYQLQRYPFDTQVNNMLLQARYIRSSYLRNLKTSLPWPLTHS